MSTPEIFRAHDSFVTLSEKGERVFVYQGDTVEAGHWLLERSPDSFEPLEVTHQVSTGRHHR